MKQGSQRLHSTVPGQSIPPSLGSNSAMAIWFEGRLKCGQPVRTFMLHAAHVRSEPS